MGRFNVKFHGPGAAANSTGFHWCAVLATRRRGCPMLSRMLSRNTANTRTVLELHTQATSSPNKHLFIVSDFQVLNVNDCCNGFQRKQVKSSNPGRSGSTPGAYRKSRRVRKASDHLAGARKPGQGAQEAQDLSNWEIARMNSKGERPSHRGNQTSKSHFPLSC